MQARTSSSRIPARRTAPDPRIFVVSRDESGVWILYRLGEQEVLHEGRFVDTWSRAQQLAAGARPAQIIGVNDDGQIVVQELYARE